MKWSWKLGQIAGISIFMHWTFLLLIGWVVIVRTMHAEDWWTVAAGVGFVLAVFACIVLHELGHALTARHYGIKTRDITLLPIGGVARLERMPEDPRQELWVALAGPAVNAAIVVVLFGLLLVMAGLVPRLNTDRIADELLMGGGNFFIKLLAVNIVLVVFNLLPAFPMDGGRVLRALLALRMDYPHATRIAANVGQAMAIVFGILGFFGGNWFLLFIAIFVYLGAEEEARLVQMRFLFRGVPVRDAMITRYRFLSPADSLSRAVDELLAGSQHDFPVVEGDALVGVLSRADLLRGLSEYGRDAPVGEIMQTACGFANETDSLETAYQRMRERGCATLPILRNGRLCGVVTLENISEWVMVNAALHEPANGRHAPVAPAAVSHHFQPVGPLEGHVPGVGREIY